VNTGEVKLPRVQRHQRLVLVNKPEPEAGDPVTCEPGNHVPESRVPEEGLGYVYFDESDRPWWQCAFCGAQRRLV
jgi:hypothetical protein